MGNLLMVQERLRLFESFVKKNGIEFNTKPPFLLNSSWWVPTYSSIKDLKPGDLLIRENKKIICIHDTSDIDISKELNSYKLEPLNSKHEPQDTILVNEEVSEDTFDFENLWSFIDQVESELVSYNTHGECITSPEAVKMLRDLRKDSGREPLNSKTPFLIENDWYQIEEKPKKIKHWKFFDYILREGKIRRVLEVKIEAHPGDKRLVPANR